MTSENQILKTIQDIKKKHTGLFECLEKVQTLSEEIMRSPSIIWDETAPFSKVVIVFMASSMHRLRSVQLLCENGQAKDAMGIVRSMFEELLDFAYMQKEKSKIQDFFDYDDLLRLKLGNVIEKGGSSSDIAKTKTRNEELKKKWEVSKPRFTFKDKYGKEHTFSRWSGKGGIREIAVKVGMEKQYDFIWHWFSNFTHTSTLFADHYILGMEQGMVVVEKGATDDLIGEVVKTAIDVFLNMLRVVNEEYKLSFVDRIDELTKAFKKES